MSNKTILNFFFHQFSKNLDNDIFSDREEIVVNTTSPGGTIKCFRNVSIHSFINRSLGIFPELLSDIRTYGRTDYLIEMRGRI